MGNRIKDAQIDKKLVSTNKLKFKKLKFKTICVELHLKKNKPLIPYREVLTIPNARQVDRPNSTGTSPRSPTSPSVEQNRWLHLDV